YTLLFSHLSLPRLILVGGAHEHPPLYYLIVHAVLQIHDSYLVPRAISVVCGALSVLVLFYLGKRLYGPAAGLCAAALLAVSPFHLWFSQDGRGYELAGLLVLGSYLFLFTALDQPKRSTWIMYAACTALTVYSEYTTVFVLVPQVALLLRARERGLTRSLVLSWLAVILAYAPWIGVVAINTASIAGSYWIPRPDAHVVANTVLEFLGLLTPCASPPCSGHELAVPLLHGNEIPIAAIAFAIVLVVGAASMRRRDLTTVTLVLWLVVPFILVLLISIGWSLYLDRVFLDATFPLYLMGGAALAGVGRNRRKWLPAILVLLVGAASVANLESIYAGGSNPDWRSAVRDFQAAYRPGQSVLFNPGVLRSLVASYLPAGWHATTEVPLWSRSYVDVPGWPASYAGPRKPDQTQRLRIEARLRNWQITMAARGRRQVWLLTLDYSGMNDTRRWFSLHGYQLAISEEYAGDTRIELWERGSPTSFGDEVYADTFTRSWSRTGRVQVKDRTAAMDGRATLSRSFSIQPGDAYSVNVEYQSIPPSHPIVWLQTFDASGQPIETFPQSEWYDLPISGVWLSAPFGFVAPPNAVHATLWLGNLWGATSWRHVVVYRER
ncbi:MAG TPA: glycosyltransferase family 39 protein, partial [Chloroflexota bacterium]